MYNDINSNNVPSLVKLAIEFEGQSVDQCAKNIAAQYNVSNTDAYFLATEIAEFNNREDTKEVREMEKVRLASKLEKFEFSKGGYKIEIFATSFSSAYTSWNELQQRNYYPTGKKWYAETKSCNPPQTELSFKKGDTKKFLDYTIKYCTNNDGILLFKEGASKLYRGHLRANFYESHLGNYETLDSAQAAAVVFFMLARPNVFANSLLHKIMGGAGSGTYHEYTKLLDVCVKEKIQIPVEITNIGGTNSVIGYKGKALCWHNIK